MRSLVSLLCLQLMVISAFGQYSLKGVVTGNGERLAGANAVIKDSFYGMSTGSNGGFEFINLKEGDYTLKVSFIGFETEEVKIQLVANMEISVDLTPDVVMTGEVLVSATRAGDKTPMAYSNLSKETIDERNLGQDIPYLLQLTPSFVATSDAGAGVGYTNFRIRGTDLNRINVTVNGIPLNDAESHGTWFVDLPDLASSLENVQIQRGVGTSTNGAAAFGATINLQTNTIRKKAYSEYKTALGSFNTFKNTISAGTGMLNGKFTLDARLSKVSSDGYVDRASSDLKSFFVSGGFYTDKTVLKLNVFSGFEETYQAWNGIPSELLNTDRTYNSAGYYTNANGEDRYYENQVDYYQQDHYQLHFSHRFSKYLNLNTSGHFTYGRGYYENYEPEEDLNSYLIPYPIFGNDIIYSSDIVNRKWLDNYFYGVTFSMNYLRNKSDITIGGGWSTYDGDHFGNVIWGNYLGSVETNHKWYFNNGLKKDFNIYAKYNYTLYEKLNIFADLQYRLIDYTIDGLDDDQRDIAQESDFGFFNPKLGLFYQPAFNHDIYLSFAVANREPNRTAYVDADPMGKKPVYETLNDWELGYNYKSSIFSLGANIYYMKYKNQLVITGEINDVGAAITANVDKSYRAGIELQAGLKITPELEWRGNATFSRNKIKDFVEYVDKYDEDWNFEGQEIIELGTTDLAFSPEVLANSQILFEPVKRLQFSLNSAYVGKQYIDNTSSNQRSLDAYFVSNLKADYLFTTGLFEKITIHILLNNLFDEEYESNAWVYSYFLGAERYKIDGYFPQAGVHLMAGVDFKF